MARLLLTTLLTVLLLTACTGDDPIPTVTAPWAAQPAEALRGDTLSVLLIGNSFAQDAVDSYLDSLLSEAGVTYCIGRLHLESASLKMHLDHIIRDDSVYDYQYYTPDTLMRHLPVSLAQVLQERPWAVVSVQQVSAESGKYASYRKSLPRLVRQLRYFLPSDTRLALHVTWAYPNANRSREFRPYRYDPSEMQRAIVDAADRALTLCPLDMRVPTGTAIHIARQDGILNADGCDLCRDDRHLSIPLGRYIAALTWYEALTGHSATSVTFAPAGLTPAQATHARQAAHQALGS